ncbi:putative transposable element [Trichonephila clavipes]|uniref:Putative transposable element n=1 Tax=Trichonephila clavipes TaxID=2585209 RepID=A0A8X6V8P8_TRICX|nr:putative transposable element [Trichonephila clavipes]
MLNPFDRKALFFGAQFSKVKSHLSRSQRGAPLDPFSKRLLRIPRMGALWMDAAPSHLLHTLSGRLTCIDEAHFWLNGYVNKQNCRIWSETNPQVYVETPLHPEKLTVWCALRAGGILLQKR